jgi:signal transduction histidine kinase
VKLAALRRRLGWRLFLSYLVIVIVGVTVLMSTAWLLAPASVSRHAAAMQAVIGDDPALVADVYRAFTQGVMEVLGVAAGAAMLTALLISLFTARRIVTPIRAMTTASQRIAAGDYGQRVPVPGDDELATLAQSFNRMAETLDQTERRRLELIGDVAHELRTPLAAIRSSMEGLIDGVLPAKTETYASIEREAARLQRLVRDLEELSRAEAGQITLERQRVALGELLQIAMQRLQGQYEDKQVGLELAPTDPDLFVRVDVNRILQVLTNLLGNALQHTPAGGQVTLRARQDANNAVVSVVDTGVGIGPEQIHYVFERFYRVDKSRSRAGGGSGIGLTISKHLVEAHGGRIWAASDGLGRGSTFAFTLPLD